MRLSWKDYEDYERTIRPRFVDRRHYDAVHGQTPMVVLGKLHERVGALSRLVPPLEALHAKLAKSTEATADLSPAITMAVDDGEFILLCCPRLVSARASYAFRSSRDVIDDFASGNPQKRLRELELLVNGCRTLLQGLNEMWEEDHEFLVGNVSLPDDLIDDFYLARDLFSIDQDDVALVMAARGLETVLRAAAERQKLRIVIKSQPHPAHEADLIDLIEGLHRTRWRVTNEPLITKETKSLLHFLRAVRNSGAHGNQRRAQSHSARETAAVMTRAAAELWQQCSRPRIRTVSKDVSKTW